MDTNITYEFDVNIIYNFENDDYTKKNFNFNNVDYEIVKYNKEKLDFYKKNNYDKFLQLSKFRSIILKNNKLLSVSPSKSLDLDIFKTLYSDVSDCWLEDFIDGTMITLFFDTTNNVWEIATKSTIGGNNIFFNNNNNYNNNISFRNLFFEACNYNNFNINTLPNNYKYIFIMQHPYNRIVTPNNFPEIFLLKIYDIKNINDSKYKITEINVKNFIDTPPYILLNTGVKIVNKYKFNSYDELINNYTNSNINFSFVGIMIYNSNGCRSKIRNKNYEYVRKLRGNQPKLQYNFLCLKKEGKVKEFLFYYPEHRNDFNHFKDEIYDYTNNLFSNYISCFIKKEKNLKEYNFEYKIHMYKLHEIFKNYPNNFRIKIDKKKVIDYVNSLHPSQQMFVINYKNYNNVDNVNNLKNVENVENVEIVENVDMMIN